MFEKICQTVYDIAKIIKQEGLDIEEYTVDDYLNKCKCLACYHSEGQKENFHEYRSIKMKESNGECFDSRIFRLITKHYKLLQAVENVDYCIELEWIETFWAHLGNGYYYKNDIIEELMENAAKLYIVAKRKENRHIHKPEISEAEKVLIESVQVLKKEGVVLKIEKGEVVLEENSEKEFISKLYSFINKAGGLYILNQLFRNEIFPKYNSKLGRYMIYRNKTLIPLSINVRIPYQYIIQLSMKCLTSNVTLSESRKQRIYNKIVFLSSCYMEVLQLQGYCSMEIVFHSLDDFPVQLYKNICFEKLYIPRQYHPQYIQLLLEKMLQPFYSNPKPRSYSFFNYMSFAKYIMENAMGPTVFTKHELKEQLKISDYKLNLILEDVSYSASELNVNFMHFSDATNSWRRPLVHIGNDQYFCLDGRMSGYAFYEVMYQILDKDKTRALSYRQGKYLEKMVYELFQKKHFSFIEGKYNTINDLPERNCDMILEDSKHVVFVEIKKCPLPNSYERANDVDVLRALGNGMLYAQEQILWHKLRLKELGKINLLDEQGKCIREFSNDDRRKIAVSLCMPEYDFLTNRIITELFLESTLFVTYHANNPEEEETLKELNKRIEKIMWLSNRLFAGEKYDVKEVFFNSQFRSLQQIWTMLKFSNSVEHFIEMCVSQLHMLTGAEDFYVEILHTLDTQINKHKKVSNSHD